MTGTESHDREATDFASRATETRPGLFVELWEFLRHNKKWWLTPIILVLLLIGALILLAGTAAAPFIYPLVLAPLARRSALGSDGSLSSEPRYAGASSRALDVWRRGSDEQQGSDLRS